MYKDSVKNIYDITSANDPLPLIFDSPHSGRTYPEDFGYSCGEEILKSAEDNYVDDLFEAVPHNNAVLLSALFPRTYIDVNRTESDIDPNLLDSKPHPDHQPTNRSHAGIGLIRRLVKPGIPVYDRSLSLTEINTRIDNYYTPYHSNLKQLIDDAHYRYGQVWHINCHSMPSHRMTINAKNGAAPFSNLPDFVLGDRNGTSCDLDLTHTLRDYLRQKNYRVAINNPYKGVELTRRYSCPAKGRHSIQIEINKALYWNEVENRPSKNYNKIKAEISELINFIASHISNKLVAIAAD